ncbi:MAG TPA: hypothetical protein VLL25_10255 [Acidimicrobiales bacterium]|nr:hypothetical protein [Acidimicrobiales bacterium]
MARYVEGKSIAVTGAARWMPSEIAARLPSTVGQEKLAAMGKAVASRAPGAASPV